MQVCYRQLILQPLVSQFSPYCPAPAGALLSILLTFSLCEIGVNATTGAKMNPLYSILSDFNEDDFIVLKLDIDHSPT